MPPSSRPKASYTCNQKPNPSCETVPLTTITALTPPGATPCPPSGKLTVLPQPFQIRVSFFLYGCWTSGICMRKASIPQLPGLIILAAPMLPGATPCPLSGTGQLSTGCTRPHVQNRVSFFLYECWTSGMCTVKEGNFVIDV
jgi:hypothetical protein